MMDKLEADIRHVFEVRKKEIVEEEANNAARRVKRRLVEIVADIDMVLKCYRVNDPPGYRVSWFIDDRSISIADR